MIVIWWNSILGFSKEFPTDSKGEKLNLLAQINFDKEKFNDDRLPQKGILQFYISSNDDIYGMNFDEQDKQTDWRVIYHEITLIRLI